MKQVKLPKALWLILILFLLISMVTTVIAVNNPMGRSYPSTVNTGGKDGEDGKDATIDYELIGQYIREQLAALPTPKDGKDGQSVTPDQIASAVSAYLQINPPAKGDTGVQGDPGVTKTFSVRCVLNVHRIDIKFDSDDNWSPWFYFGAEGSCPDGGN